MPLNGRSFQTLIALTPGVVLTQTNANAPGQFSVNGQRTDANYFTVDGVSANFGSSAGSGAALYQTAGGAIPALSASGGTNSLVSVDAMQEFRIQTSSFAPEFGSTPGGQVAIVTRSGTNQFHGTLFDYFRNDVLDARDWFVNQNGLQKPKERQNDFGGVLGGHIIKNKTFFFFSYEGLRLRQPRVAVTLVPDNQSRQTAPAPTMPFLNAFPVANGQALGNGVAKFTASYSDPSSLDAYSIRIDHAIHSKLSLFGRYNNAPSDTVQRQTSQALSDLQTTQITTRTFTLALVANIAKDKINELRVNYSTSRAAGFYSLDQFGGAVPLSDGALFPTGFSSSNGRYQFFVNGVGGLLIGKDVTNEQRQVNVLDNLQITRDAHLLKFGFDYRWLAPLAGPSAYQQLAFFFGMTGSSGALSGVLPFDGITALQGSALLSQNFSLYGQDTWKATQRLTLTYGLRWNVNPALRGKNSNSELFTVSGLDNPATMTLAPRGTPLYATTYGNVAPRVGVAYKLTQSQNWGSVLRGAFGVFYDLGTGSLGAATSGFPHSANKFLFGVPFPVTGPQAAPPIISSNPPVSLIYVSDPHLKLPRTYEWNVAVEQSLGADQTVSATYVGALGRDLLRQDTLSSPNPTFTGSVSVTRNTSASYFHALQVKFQRRLSLGLQVLASYSFSHSIDSGSEDFFLYNTPGAVTNSYVDRGNSDFDVRHAFTAAVSYDVPAPGRSAVAHLLLGGWSLDAFVMARSALPVGISTAISVVNGSVYSARPNVVPGVPLYLYGSQYPGGKRFNSAAFIAPTPGQR